MPLCPARRKWLEILRSDHACRRPGHRAVVVEPRCPCAEANSLDDPAAPRGVLSTTTNAVDPTTTQRCDAPPGGHNGRARQRRTYSRSASREWRASLRSGCASARRPRRRCRCPRRPGGGSHAAGRVSAVARASVRAVRLDALTAKLEILMALDQLGSTTPRVVRGSRDRAARTDRR